MTPIFAIGEIAIGQNFVRCIECNGVDIEVVAGPFLSPDVPCVSPQGDVFFGIFYQVRFGAHEAIECLPAYNLRKKRPPSPDDSFARQEMLDCIERAKLPQAVPA